MKEIEKYFSPDLLEILKSKEYEKNNIGCSNTHVFFIKNIEEGKNAYLKISSKENIERLKNEVNIIKWLEGKIPVPVIYLFEENEYYEFMLMSEIKGIPSYSEELRKNSYNIISVLAKGLKKIHEIEISDCQFNEKLEKKLRVIEKKIRNNEIDLEDFEEENKGKSIEEIYGRIKELKENIKEELVFTHGDYCMPNILIEKNELSGFIDLGRAGVSDKYQDIALMMRSLKYNGFTQEEVNIFLKEYGITEIDEDKIEFYKLIDEFY